MTESGESSSAKQPCRREDALAVLLRLREAGHIAYFAGGCVRDELLGLQPKDFDIATDAPPPRVRELFRSTQAVGAAFGVILVRQGPSIVEVATFRAEGPYLDGRHPSQVRFTSAEEDARRRDFTINGLFLDPVSNRVIDYVGGQEDLKQKLLRAIGEPAARFDEDHLRMLRAVRFASRFGLSTDPATMTAIRTHASKLKQISPERIGEELRVMLTPPTRVVAWDLLWESQLMPVLFRTFPEAPARSPQTDAIFTRLAPGADVSFGVALATIVFAYRGGASHLFSHDEVRRSVRACRALLRISNDEADTVAGVLSIDGLAGNEPPRLATLKRFLAKPYSHDARLFMAALEQSGSDVADNLARLRVQFEALAGSDVAPPPLLTGDDLVAMGYTPGPAFKRVLDRVYDEQLENTLSSRDQAVKLAAELMSAAG